MLQVQTISVVWLANTRAVVLLFIVFCSVLPRYLPAEYESTFWFYTLNKTSLL